MTSLRVFHGLSKAMDSSLNNALLAEKSVRERERERERKRERERGGGGETDRQRETEREKDSR